MLSLQCSTKNDYLIIQSYSSSIMIIYISSQKISDNFDCPNIYCYCDTNFGNLKMKGKLKNVQQQSLSNLWYRQHNSTGTTTFSVTMCR